MLFEDCNFFSKNYISHCFIYLRSISWQVFFQVIYIVLKPLPLATYAAKCNMNQLQNPHISTSTGINGYLLANEME